jgi:hypothetical protein
VDIIGLTVVVYYPDQIEIVVREVRAHQGLFLGVEKDAPVTRNGYHAHHIVVQSNDPAHADLRCEVQVKTMMHDARAAKMHDLNYKPQGYTDKRLSAMMGVFGDALQSIEKQSELLRNLIHERWNAEVGRRRAARRTLFSQLPVIRSRKAFSDEANKIYRDIQSACGSLEGAISTSNYILAHIALPAEDRAMVQFNLANFLVEEAAFDPMLPDTAARRARIEALMRDCAHIEVEDPSAFHDLRGMLELAPSADAAAVRRAVDQIRLGLDTAIAEDQDIALMYFELHSRLAWRRLLELEAETVAEPLPPALPPPEVEQAITSAGHQPDV